MAAPHPKDDFSVSQHRVGACIPTERRFYRLSVPRGCPRPNRKTIFPSLSAARVPASQPRDGFSVSQRRAGARSPTERRFYRLSASRRCPEPNRETDFPSLRVAQVLASQPRDDFIVSQHRAGARISSPSLKAGPAPLQHLRDGIRNADISVTYERRFFWFS